MMKKISLFLFLIIGITGCKFEATGKPWNVIIFMTDDMGHGDIAAHGNPLLKTPNFDRLHDEAVRFTNFGVSPTCSPTRAALMTGRYEFLVGVTHTVEPLNLMDTDAVTIAELFRKKGYKTGHFGKWHLGQSDEHGPWSRGFDETLTVPGDRQNSHFDPVMLQNREKKKFMGYRTDILFDEAMKFMDRNRDNPFFCYLPTYSAHGPNIAPEKYLEPFLKYKDADTVIIGYCGQVINLDENLGRLLSFLDSTGLVENTLLIALNDNGSANGIDVFNSGMRGRKGVVYQGGPRAYSFWRLGNKYPSGDRDQMSGHVDILPTLADICGLDMDSALEEQLDGISLKKVLEDPYAKLDADRMLVHHRGRWLVPGNWSEHKYCSCVVRWGNYTLVRVEFCNDLEHCVDCRKVATRSKKSEHYRLTEPGEWELFDLARDWHQDYNIAGENPEIVMKMSKYYEEWWARVEVKMTEKWGPAN
jgi:arylsulfatase A-like enzyme